MPNRHITTEIEKARPATRVYAVRNITSNRATVCAPHETTSRVELHDDHAIGDRVWTAGDARLGGPAPAGYVYRKAVRG